MTPQKDRAAPVRQHRQATPDKTQLNNAEFPASDGRTQVLNRLLAACLYDRDLCALLDQYRDGIVLKIPPLDELHRIAWRSA